MGESPLPAGNGTWSYNPLYPFVGGAFCGPYGNLAFDGKGDLYGTTDCSDGVFKLTPGSPWTLTPLHLVPAYPPGVGWSIFPSMRNAPAPV
jgi:hypothetical protein